MVNHCWANCDLCAKNAIGELNVWVPVCLYCGVVIANFFFHDDCVKEIFDVYERKIIEKYREKLKICCKTCSNKLIGFDFIDLEKDLEREALASEVD